MKRASDVYADLVAQMKQWDVEALSQETDILLGDVYQAVIIESATLLSSFSDAFYKCYLNKKKEMIAAACWGCRAEEISLHAKNVIYAYLANERISYSAVGPMQPRSLRDHFLVIFIALHFDEDEIACELLNQAMRVDFIFDSSISGFVVGDDFVDDAIFNLAYLLVNGLSEKDFNSVFPYKSKNLGIYRELFCGNIRDPDGESKRNIILHERLERACRKYDDANSEDMVFLVMYATFCLRLIFFRFFENAA